MNDNRPIWYDQKLAAYQPYIRRLVNRAVRVNRDDVVQDVYVEAMNKWHLYRDEYRFGTWIGLMVRNVISDKLQKSTRKKRIATIVSLDREGVLNISTDPVQHDYVELSQVLRRLSGTRDSDVLMRIAMGDELGEIGADYGISRERVRQLGERERGRLVRVAA